MIPIMDYTPITAAEYEDAVLMLQQVARVKDDDPFLPGLGDFIRAQATITLWNEQQS